MRRRHVLKMHKRRFQKSIRTIHALCGVFLSAFVLVLSVSGSLLIFKEDYLKLVEPATRTAPDLSDVGLANILQRAEDIFGEESINSVTFARLDFGLHKISLNDGSAAYLGSDGSLIDRWKKNGRFEEWLFDLHHYLLIGDTGKTLIGFVGLALIGMVITGCIAFWPMRKAFRLGLKLRGGNVQFLRLTHRNLGVLLAIPILVITVTGSGVIFNKPTKNIMGAIFGGPSQNNQYIVTVPEHYETDWSVLLAASRSNFPEGIPRMANFKNPNRSAQIRVRQSGEWHPNGLTSLTLYDEAAQKVLVLDALRLNLGYQTYNGFYPLHAAKVGGRIYDLLLLIVALSFAFLSLLGALSYVRKLLKI